MSLALSCPYQTYNDIITRFLSYCSSVLDILSLFAPNRDVRNASGLHTIFSTGLYIHCTQGTLWYVID